MQHRTPPAPAVEIDPRTPAVTARLFLDTFYPRPRLFLRYDNDNGFGVGTDGQIFVAVKTKDIAAQVFQWLSGCVDRQGAPFQPSPSRVRAVVWAIKHTLTRVNIPLPGGTQTYEQVRDQRDR